jgi:hypothetical protein
MTDDLDKISTPRGEARSMQTLPPDMVVNSTNAPPGTGADWFGPLQPMRPIAPPQVAGRAFDFMPGYNLNTQPRFGELLDFETLRMLAESYDPIRLIIERRKDQMCRLPWKIRVKHEDGGKRPTSAQLSPATRGLIQDVTRFFKNPTDDLSFRPWLRMLLDDLLVIDAPSLYCERDAGGTLIALAPIDGGTVKRVIDDHGRTPRPFRWDGGAFDWCGQTVGPGNFDELGFKITNGMVYPPAFQQILKGLPAVNYTTWDLLYRPLNLRTNHVYGYSPIAQIVTTVSIAMRRSMSQLEYFREGNQPESIYGLPETWTPDKVQSFQDYWDNLFVGNLGNRRRMKFLPGGANNAYTALKEPPLKSEFDEWLVRIVCFALSYPPQAFVALSNRSTAEQHERTAEEEGLEPLKNWLTDLANEVIEREFSEDLELVFAEEDEVDQEKQSKILTRYTDSGVMTRNEAREKLGLSPDPSQAANQLAVKTATGVVPIDGDVDPDDADDDGDATKLAKGAITMKAPKSWKPVQRFTLGRTIYLPNIAKRQLIVHSADDAVILEMAGWTRA